MVETAQNPTIRCWLCGHTIEVKFTVKSKPYLVCDIRSGGCGTQTFLRDDKAIQLLQDKIKSQQGGTA